MTRVTRTHGRWLDSLHREGGKIHSWNRHGGRDYRGHRQLVITATLDEGGGNSGRIPDPLTDPSRRISFLLFWRGECGGGGYYCFYVNSNE
jgi:hypothetical protein